MGVYFVINKGSLKHLASSKVNEPMQARKQALQAGTQAGTNAGTQAAQQSRAAAATNSPNAI
jgi:hypothetical protein